MMHLYTYQSTTFDPRLERETQFDWNIETLPKVCPGVRKDKCTEIARGEISAGFEVGHRHH